MTTAQHMVANHPLLIGTRKTFDDWPTWKRLWNEAEFIEIRLGLLHGGLGAYPSSMERILFYLDVADGHEDVFGPLGNSTLNREPPIYRSSGVEKSLGEALRFLAAKAFRELAKHCFTPDKDGPRENANWLTSPEIVDKLIWFVRMDEEGRIGNLRSHQKSHALTVTRNFFRELARFAFTDSRNLGYKHAGYHARISELLFPRRAELIPVLNVENDLLWLLDRHVIGTLDGACLAALRKIALLGSSHFPDACRDEAYRAPRTLDEACYANRPAAHVLMAHAVWQKERNRLREEG